MQMQEDEIQLLKLALADVLKRLNISEEHQAAAAASAASGGRRTPGAKGEKQPQGERLTLSTGDDRRSQRAGIITEIYWKNIIIQHEKSQKFKRIILKNVEE